MRRHDQDRSKPTYHIGAHPMMLISLIKIHIPSQMRWRASIAVHSFSTKARGLLKC
jgi:hypothetical protein